MTVSELARYLVGSLAGTLLISNLVGLSFRLPSSG